MRNDHDRMRRREFLRLSGTGIAAAGVRAIWPGSSLSAQSEVPSGIRTRPERPLFLRSNSLEVVLDPDDGVPFEYCWLATGARLRGETFGEKMVATICKPAESRFFPVTVASPVLMPGNHASSLRFRFDLREGANHNSPLCATFILLYELTGASLQITLEDIVEPQGYELIDVAMSHLVSTHEEDGNAWLVHGDSGGSLVMLSDATEGELPPNSFWGHINGSLPVNMIGTDQLMCSQETLALMDTTSVTVTGKAGGRCAALGSGRVHRVNGHDCFNLNLGAGAPLNCGGPATPNLLVEDVPKCRLDFLPVEGDPRSAWIKAGRVIRDRMPAIPNQFYHDKYMYGIRCDEPRFERPAATFAQCEQLIADIAELTDNAPQIVHLWGWQFKGKDTGYPAVTVVNERIGGFEGMMQLMERGRAHNATVTLSDNYDDAYRSSPAWDEAMIARRPDGRLWQSREWTGEVSYIQGLAKYMEGPGPERVRFTCEHYKLPETIHVDVLSYYAIRNDWDPKVPASGIRNLRAGRYRVLEEFAKHGVDVTSEGLRYPMIGKISSCWYAQTAETSPLGGKPIPLLPLIYGKSAIWGLNGNRPSAAFTTRARYLFWNAAVHEIINAETDRKQITDVFYLNLIPWMHLHKRAIESFARDGERVTIGLEGNCRIEIDYEKAKYRLTIEGENAADEQSIFCPMDSDRLCFYSLSARELTAPWPRGWKESEAVAVALSIGRREPATFRVHDGRVMVQVSSQQPVIIYRQRKPAAS